MNDCLAGCLQRVSALAAVFRAAGTCPAATGRWVCNNASVAYLWCVTCPHACRASGTDAVAIDEDPAAAGPRCSHDSAAGATELAAGLGSLVQQVKTLDLTARQMEVWLAMSTAVNTSTLADADWAEADKSPPVAAPNGNS